MSTADAPDPEIRALNALGQFRVLLRADGINRERLEGALDQFAKSLTAIKEGDEPASAGDPGTPFAPDDECGFCYSRALRPRDGDQTALECSVCGTIYDSRT